LHLPDGTWEYMRKYILISSFLVSLIILYFYNKKYNIIHDHNETTELPQSKKNQKNQPVESINQKQGDTAIILKRSDTKYENIDISEKREKPKSMREVRMTPGIEESLKNFEPYVVYKWDYLLGFLDRFENCIIENQLEIPRTSIEIALVFDVDQQIGVGTGIDFYFKEEPVLNEEVKGVVENCGLSSVKNSTFDVSKFSELVNNNLTYFATIEFPIEETYVYRFIKSDGNPD
jgi:hypothetical protein